ncbi:Yos1-like protein [Gregarina niphandrodes]|uniref:Yos1-like protein n=1 Tax=Gregarina niphandrodes TaxID=110365 RepID=A0A023B404_GRENI|nr:Yos1-like protein [Gregarina niphandrodes]EZG56148.1 Yos1-like protein [Gregarina niphandrodes]|eukprot:XP_011131321.1 Yos1-like protein [Gregarina niphandrodes]
MGLSLWHLIEASILGANGLAILNEKRLLVKWGLDRPVADEGGLKFQISIVLYAFRNYIRRTTSLPPCSENHLVPKATLFRKTPCSSTNLTFAAILVILNVLVIIVEALFG